MSNSLLNISMITRESLRELKNQLSFAGSVNRQYDDKFAKDGAKIGSVLNIRKPVRFEVKSGAALQLQDVADQSVALTLDTQEHVAFQFSSKDLALSIDEFRERYIKPAITAIANKIDYSGCQLYKHVWNAVGTPGTAPTSVETALLAGQKLDENGAPVDDNRSLVISPALQTAFVKAGLSLYNDQAELAKQYKKGRMGVAAGFTWKMDQNMASHTTGEMGGTPKIKTTISSQGATQVVLDGIAGSPGAGFLNVGDVFTIANVYALNPQSKQSTGSLQQFVVTEGVTEAGGEATVKFAPAIYTEGAYANCSALPQDEAAILLFGHASNYASKTSTTGLAFHKDAFVLGMADLPLPGGVDMASRASDPDAGLSLRIVRDYDINNDRFPCRIDVIYGWKAIYPELACRVQG